MLCSIEDERLISFMVFFSFILAFNLTFSCVFSVDKLIRYRFCLLTFCCCLLPLPIVPGCYHLPITRET
ncbi:hypothetical protein BDV32DRAFT_122237 [Aspergillus pseudonomiae]|nr:hypothetical protein BDV32DRAFT_122237 [Aspergillus pseudonomiae]